MKRVNDHADFNVKLYGANSINNKGKFQNGTTDVNESSKKIKYSDDSDSDDSCSDDFHDYKILAMNLINVNYSKYYLMNRDDTFYFMSIDC